MSTYSESMPVSSANARSAASSLVGRSWCVSPLRFNLNPTLSPSLEPRRTRKRGGKQRLPPLQGEGGGGDGVMRAWLHVYHPRCDRRLCVLCVICSSRF